MLKYSIWIVLLLTISGIIFWREKASIQENVIIEQLDMNSKMDFNISYTLNTSGFPNRLDTAVKKLKIKERNTGNEFAANKILVMSLIYDSDKTILSIAPPLRLMINDNILEIPSGKLQVSISIGKQKNSPTFTLHGKNLIARIDGKDLLTVKNLIFATRFAEGLNSKHWEIFIKIHDLYLTRLGRDVRNKTKTLAFDFNFSNFPIEELTLTTIPFLEKTISESVFTTTGTLEIINTNLDLKNDLRVLPLKFKEFLISSQTHR